MKQTSNKDSILIAPRCFSGYPQPGLFGAKSADIGNAYTRGACTKDTCIKVACIRDTYIKSTYVKIICIKGAYTKGASTRDAYISKIEAIECSGIYLQLSWISELGQYNTG